MTKEEFRAWVERMRDSEHEAMLRLGMKQKAELVRPFDPQLADIILDMVQAHIRFRDYLKGRVT